MALDCDGPHRVLKLVSPVGTVAFSRDSRLLAVCTLEEGLSVWDLEEMTLASASKAETGGCPLSALFFPDPFQEESGREKRERDKEGVGGAHCSSTMMQRSFSASLSQVLSRSLQSREDLHEGVMRDRELRGTQSENQKRHSASARFVPSRPPNLPKPGRIPHHFLYTTNEDGMMRQWVIPDGKGKEGTEGGGKGAVDMFVRQRAPLGLAVTSTSCSEDGRWIACAGSDGKVRLFDRHRKGGGSRKAAVLDPSARLPALPSFLSHERSALGLGDPPLPLQEALPPPTSVYQFPPRALTRRPDDPSTPRRMLSRTYSGWSRPPSPTSPGRTPAQRAAEDAVCLAEVLFFPRHPSLLLSLSAALNGPPHLSALRVFDLSRLPKSAADAGGLASSPLRLSVFCLPGRFTRAATGPSDLVAFAEPDTPSKVVVGLLEVQYEDAKESEEDRKEPPPVRHVNLRAAAADLGGMRAEVRTLKWTPGWREPLHGGGDEEGARGLAVRGDSLLVPPSLLAVGLFDGRIMLLRVTLADVRCSLKERPFGGMEDIRDGSSVVGTVPVTDRDSLSPSRGGFVRHRGAPSTALCIEHVAMLEGHTGPINCLDFAPFPLPFGPPFGLFLASGSADRSCRLWDLSKVLPNKGGLTKDEVANVKRRQRFGLPAFKQSSLATQQAADPDAKRGQLPFVQRAHVPRMRAVSPPAPVLRLRSLPHRDTNRHVAASPNMKQPREPPEREPLPPPQPNLRALRTMIREHDRRNIRSPPSACLCSHRSAITDTQSNAGVNQLNSASLISPPKSHLCPIHSRQNDLRFQQAKLLLHPPEPASLLDDLDAEDERDKQNSRSSSRPPVSANKKGKRLLRTPDKNKEVRAGKTVGSENDQSFSPLPPSVCQVCAEQPPMRGKEAEAHPEETSKCFSSCTCAYPNESQSRVSPSKQVPLSAHAKSKRAAREKRRKKGLWPPYPNLRALWTKKNHSGPTILTEDTPAGQQHFHSRSSPRARTSTSLRGRSSHSPSHSLKRSTGPAYPLSLCHSCQESQRSRPRSRVPLDGHRDRDRERGGASTGRTGTANGISVSNSRPSTSPFAWSQLLCVPCESADNRRRRMPSPKSRPGSRHTCTTAGCRVVERPSHRGTGHSTRPHTHQAFASTSSQGPLASPFPVADSQTLMEGGGDINQTQFLGEGLSASTVNTGGPACGMCGCTVNDRVGRSKQEKEPERRKPPRQNAFQGSQQETVRVRERDDYLMGSSQLSRETQAREIPTVSIQSDNAREEAEALSIRYCSCPGGPLGAQVSQEIRADGSPLRFPLTTPVTLGRPEILRQPSPLSLGPGPILSPPHRHSSSPPERPSPLCESLDCKCCPRRASTPAGASVHETLGRETVGKRGFSGCNTEEGGIRKRSTSVSSVLVPIQPSNDPNNENSRTDDRQPQSRGTSPPASRIGDGPAPQPLPRDGQRLKSESALPIQGTQQTGDALSSLSVSKEEEEMDVEVISVSESSRRSENTHTRVEMETMAEEAAASAIDAVLGFPSSHPLWQTRDPPPSSPPSRPFRKETGSNSKEGQEEKPPQPKSLVNPDHQEKTQQDDIEEEKGTDMPPPFPLPPSRRSSIRGPKSPQLPHPVERPDWKTNGQRQQTESQGGKGDGDEESRSSSERPPFIFSPTVDGGDAGMPAEASLTLSFSAQGSQSELDDSSTLLALCTDFVKNAVATATAKALAEGLLPGLHPDRQQASEGIVGREGETGPAHLPGGGQPAGLGANLSGQRTEQETGTPNPFPVSQRPETEASVSPSVSTKHHKAERSPALSVQGSQASTETREVVSAVSADFLRSLFADAAMQALTQALPATLTAESSRRQPEDAAPPPSSSHPSRPERQPQTLEQTLPQAPGGQNAAGLSRNTETQTEKKQKKKIKRLILPAADANDGTDTAGSAVEAGTTHATALPLQQDQGLQTERRIGRGPSRLSSGRPGERKEEGYGPKSSKPAVLFNEDEGDKEGGGTAVAIVQTESRSRAQTVRVVDSDGARRSVEGTRLVHKLVEGGRETDRDDSHSGPHTTAADRGVQTRGARLKPVSRGEVGDLPGQGGTVGGEMEQGTQTRSKRRTPRPRQANGDKDTVLSVMALYERALEEAQKAAAESNTQ